MGRVSTSWAKCEKRGKGFSGVTRKPNSSAMEVFPGLVAIAGFGSPL